MNTQITEDYVSFEVAQLLKEKGFDIPCDNYYDSSGKAPNENVYGGANIETLDYNADPFVKFGFPKFKTFSAPTQSTAMKWLREVHKININVLYDAQRFVKTDGTTEDVDVYEVDIITKNGSIYIGNYNHYESACEAAIKYCLTNLI